MHSTEERDTGRDDTKDRTSLPTLKLLTMASRRKDRKRISAESSLNPADDPNGRGTELDGSLHEYHRNNSTTVQGLLRTVV